MPERVIQYEIEIDGVDPGELRVVQFQAREALSEGCRVEAELLARPSLDPEVLVGARATFRVRLGDDVERPFHGVVLRAWTEAPRAHVYRLRVEIGARVALLELGRDARMFQNKSVDEIVKAVLDGAGLGADTSWKLGGTYAKREYTAQYNESDFAFVTRILADEGIAFAVQQRADAEEIVFFDDASGLTAIEGDATLRVRDDTQLGEDTVSDLRVLRAVASDATMVRDYDFKRPGLDLSASEQAPKSTGREVYQHPGRFTEVSAGRKVAKRLLERLRVGTEVLRGQSDCPRLEPGRTFSVDGHARAEAQAELLVTEVWHRGHVGVDGTGAAVAYENEFVAIPKSTPYRPAVQPAPPATLQVAFITVPAGEEIHADRYGRVKVRFPWDRAGITDDKSSAWLRVGQLALGGAMTLPRHPFEVLVDFELGEIDRPFVAGHVYNGEHRAPYALPANKTRSSLQTATTAGGPGANELRFEDSAGAEEIFMNASKDFTMLVDHDAQRQVAHDEKVTIGSNHTLLVGADHSAIVTANRKLTVGAQQSVDVGGRYSEGVGKNASVTVGAARKVQVGGDHSEDCKGTLSRTVGALQSVTALAGYERRIVGDSTTNVGAAWMEIVAGSRTSSAGGSRTETVGALKLVRAKTVSVSCGGALTTNAAAKSAQCSGDRSEESGGALAVQAGGGLSLKAQNITITAERRLVVIAGPCVISLQASGTVSVKAPQVDLTGVKALSQIMHQGN